jgi:four helix bundle protein
LVKKKFLVFTKKRTLYKKLQREKEFIVLRQVSRSAASIGVNIEEAFAGQSKEYFTAKVSISFKEVRETKRWLR